MAVNELHGIGVSPGTAAGPLYRAASAPELGPPQAVSSVDLEAQRAVDALAAVAADLMARSATAANPAAVEILRAQAMMVDDPVLRDAVAAGVSEGLDAAHAIDAALARHRAAFVAAGGYLAERAADLDDLRDRAVAVVLGRPMPGLPDPGHPYVLAARDLAPADTAGLDPGYVLALVTEEGGPTSHTAIVARALGIPAVVSCAAILAVADETTVAVDGTTGAVRLNPTPDDVRSLSTQETARRERLARSSGPGRTADGHPVALLANIGTAADLTGPAGDGVEGVGLFRTELLYLDRDTPPSWGEQAGAYTDVFHAAAGRRIVVRTLDAGADKPLPFLNQKPEPNPALGVRGLRLGRRDPQLLPSQLSAIAAAARATGAEVWVMAPMVATFTEAADFAAACHEVGLSKVGIMIEIPAAALQAAQLLSTVDFLSIGTNDLSQYTFAADRMNGELADLLDPWQPALLRLILACAEAGAAAGKPVGICGEAASDPGLAPVLAGLGITSLSMAPRAIPEVREALAARTFADCQALAAAALAASTALQARAAAGSARSS
jgi:phosphotransferase system enzyme I (PtsI)